MALSLNFSTTCVLADAEYYKQSSFVLFFCCWEDEEIYFIFPFSLWWGFFRLSIIINFYFDRQSFIIKQNESKRTPAARQSLTWKVWCCFFEGQNDDKIQCVRQENFVLWLICYNIYKTFTLLISLSFLIFSHSSFHHIWNLRSAKQSVTFCVLHPWGWNLYFFFKFKNHLLL